MSSSGSELSGAIAVTRFGLGARPGEIAEAARDARGYLLAQTEPSAAPGFPGVAGSAERLIAVHHAQGLDSGAAGQSLRDALARDELFTRFRHAVVTPNSFRERWTLFWVNHFALQMQGGYSEMLSGAFAREAVEPRQFGRFEDLLVAAVQHPAMLIALNQAESVGPDSVVGRAQNRGIDENLAREALELHSIGVEGGYDQTDVRELAYAMAGWTIADAGGAADVAGRFTTDQNRRQPGARRLLGRSYPQSPSQAETMLRDVARRPETYRRIGYLLARHVVGDQPEPTLVARLSGALQGSGGSLAALARALVEAPEAWSPRQAKFKTPYEQLVSAHRAGDVVPEDPQHIRDLCETMGHVPLWAPSARGASDDAESWTTSLGLAQRAAIAQTVGPKSGAKSGLGLATTALGPLLSPSTRRVLADSGTDSDSGLALALMSPEFLRR